VGGGVASGDGPNIVEVLFRGACWEGGGVRVDVDGAKYMELLLRAVVYGGVEVVMADGVAEK